MIRVVVDTSSFVKSLSNVVKYTEGFLEGVRRGKPMFLTNVGAGIVQALKEYIDSNARVNPEMLHHVYEWYQTGSAESRLFDIDYKVSGLGLSFNSSFRQSSVVKAGSNVPFYNKADIMENGIGVTIRPKAARVLAFTTEEGQEVFTPNEVRVSRPGGNVQGQYEKIFESFFTLYFTQAFLRSSGIWHYLENPFAFKANVRAGSKMGKSKGIEVGQQWISKAGIIR
jgi:hypothetical protein